MVETSVMALGSSSMEMINERSIFKWSTGSLARYPNDE